MKLQTLIVFLGISATACAGTLKADLKAASKEQWEKALGGQSTKELLSRIRGNGGKGADLITGDGQILPLEQNQIKPSGASALIQRAFRITRKGEDIVAEPQPVPALQHWTQTQQLLEFAKFKDLHQAYAGLEDADKKASGGADADLDEMKPALTAVSEQLAAAFSGAASTEQKQAICSNFREISTLQKAIYQRLDNYSPAVYKRIYDQCSSVVGIAMRGRPPIGSGVVIGKGLVLTCNHVVDGLIPQQLDVLFNYDGPDQGQRVAVKSLLVKGSPFPAGGKDLDFALLEINQPEGEASYPVLFSPSLKEFEAVYVIGHPDSRPKTVHDNAFVLFPFEATEGDLARFRLRICAETDGEPDQAAELERFHRNYRRPSGADLPLFRLFSDEKWGQQPTVAVDADTFHGNSGGPAFLRVNGGLVGLLYAGQPDSEKAYAAGWRRHEGIIPISAIIEQLNSWRPGWVQEFGATVQ